MGKCPRWHGADPPLLEVAEAGDPAPACQCHGGLHPLQTWYIAHLLPPATSVSYPGLEALATRLCPLASNFLWQAVSGDWPLTSVMPRGQPVDLASPALRQGPNPCWPSRPAISWQLVADQLSTWPTGLDLATRVSSQGWPLLASGWMENLWSSTLASSTSSERSSLWIVWTLATSRKFNWRPSTRFTLTLPTPPVERLRPDLAWQTIWPRLDGPSLVAKEVNLHFSLLHNLLGVLANQHHSRLAASPACLFCRPPAAAKTVLHFFTNCTRSSASWHFLLFRAMISLGRTLTDEDLLFLVRPPSAARVDAAGGPGSRHLPCLGLGHQRFLRLPSPS
jgi:hypothetical protein